MREETGGGCECWQSEVVSISEPQLDWRSRSSEVSGLEQKLWRSDEEDRRDREHSPLGGGDPSFESSL